MLPSEGTTFRLIDLKRLNASVVHLTFDRLITAQDRFRYSLFALYRPIYMSQYVHLLAHCRLQRNLKTGRCIFSSESSAQIEYIESK
jgi:hypothetical protein